MSERNLDLFKINEKLIIDFGRVETNSIGLEKKGLISASLRLASLVSVVELLLIDTGNSR